jgi:proteasome alpha subunit
MAYDRTIVVFSPDGRLLQVEYARQMVKNGSTSLGVKVADGVLLGTVKPSMQLAVAEDYRKVHSVDNHVGIVSSGSLADARNLTDYARVKAQVNGITYGEPISVTSLTREICDRKHMVTQYAGVRPYGVGLLVGGVDENGPILYETEPSGTMISWKAQAIGRGADKAKKILNKGFKDNMTQEEGLKLLLRALKAAEKNATAENAEIAVIKKDSVKRFAKNEIKKFV